MRIPAQDIPIVNNHPINFQRRIWPKSHPRAGAIFAKIHGNSITFQGTANTCFFLLAILNIIAWILLASAGVLIARYFDSIWPEYERFVVLDNNGVATGQKFQRLRQRHRPSFFNVFDFLSNLFSDRNSFLSRLSNQS